MCYLSIPVTAVRSLQLQLDCWTKARMLSCLLVADTAAVSERSVHVAHKKRMFCTPKKPSQDPRKPKYPQAVFSRNGNLRAHHHKVRHMTLEKPENCAFPRRYPVQQKVCKACMIGNAPEWSRHEWRIRLESCFIQTKDIFALRGRKQVLNVLYAF